MHGVELDRDLFRRIAELAFKAGPDNTLHDLGEEQEHTLVLFLSMLACKSEVEYKLLEERFAAGETMPREFEERLALVTRAFCVGHDWVTSYWSLWKKQAPPEEE